MRTALLAMIVFLYAPAFSQPVRSIKITSLDSVIRSADRPLLVNFWATWCLPCIEELPWLQEAVASNNKDSVELLLVSLDMKDDYPAKIDSFIRRRGIRSRVLWLDEHDADYFCPVIDPGWSGSIPGTLFINPHNGYRRFYEEQLSTMKLEKAMREMLSPRI